MPTVFDVWGWSHTCVLILFTGAVAGLFAMSWAISKDPKELQKNFKTFGLGMGPTYLDTFQVPGEERKLKMYEEYFGYRKLTRQITPNETAYYKQWYSTNTCEGGCPAGSDSITGDHCRRGVCWCEDDTPAQYGQCRPRSESHLLGDREKYRGPDAAALPDQCYISIEVDGKIQTVLDELEAHKPECQDTTKYPDEFDLNTQTCDAADPGSCLERDMNLVCGEGGKCQCRLDMEWNTDRMQCELFLDVDCTEVPEVNINSQDYKEEKELLTGQKGFFPTTKLDDAKVKTLYCNLLEKHSKVYVLYKRGGRQEPTILGYMNVAGVIFFGAGCAFGFMWLLMICGLLRICIKSLDPRYAFQTMSTGEKITALGAVAGQEMVERQEEREQERRAALMQGQAYRQ